MDRLYVYLLDVPAGELWLDDRGKFVFRYDEDYLLRDTAAPLSALLPLRQEVFDNDASRPFFSNLLPEGTVRSKIARDKKVSEKNDFALLKAIGGECAGAVSLSASPELLETGNRYEPISDEQLGKMVEASEIKPILVSRDDLRLSLAGAQNKIPLRYADGHFFMPLGSSPSTHILKPPISGYPGIVENETFCMKLANLSGLPVPDVSIWEKGNKRAYVIERYDRWYDDDGNVRRLHQEDFCQAACVRPEGKYENEGGPGISSCVDIIDHHCSVPVLEKRKFVRWLIFNYLIGNCDAHGKNISLLYTGRGTSLAPFYDLISTMAYPDLSKKMSMKIGGKKEINRVFRRHWERLASIVDMNFSVFSGLVKKMAIDVKNQSQKAAAEFDELYGRHEIIEVICGIVEAQAKHVMDYIDYQ